MESGEPGNRTRVLLMARPGRLANENALIGMLHGSGYGMSVLRDVPRLISEIGRQTESRPIAVVNLLSTCDDTKSIDGYDRFLHEYARVRRQAGSRLIVITPECGTGPDTSAGYGDLVTAYIGVPVDPAELLRYVDRIAQAMEATT